MIVDTSTLLDAEHVAIAAPTLLETNIIAYRLDGAPLLEHVQRFIRTCEMRVVPFDEEHLTIARDAYLRFGRGSGHAAQLNYGDCFAYALAALHGEPLLYKGSDFIHTNITTAVPPRPAE